MKRFLKINHCIVLIFSPLVLFTLVNCERDDICAEGTATTPRLILEFYDTDNPEDLKNVPRLTIYGDSPEIPIPDDDDFSSAILVETFGSERIYNRNTNNAGLPLIIGIEGEPTTTRFVLEKDTNLRLNENVNTTSNLDIIEISYTSEFVYVSRACGYKSIFNEVDITEVDDMDKWISSIEIEEELTVENEKTVHVRIFH